MQVCLVNELVLFVLANVIEMHPHENEGLTDEEIRAVLFVQASGIQAVVNVWDLAWRNSIIWFLFCKRDMPFLPGCCVDIEGWKYTHLLYGVLYSLRTLIFAPLYLLGVFNPVVGPHAFPGYFRVLGLMGLAYAGIRYLLMIFHELAMVCISISMVKIGMKKSGCTDYDVEYDPETVGQAEVSSEAKNPNLARPDGARAFAV
jgi:hypothetical protein